MHSFTYGKQKLIHSFGHRVKTPNAKNDIKVRLASKKNGNCQKKFCQILLNFYSLKRLFRI
jgi:hypothetical protein